MYVYNEHEVKVIAKNVNYPISIICKVIEEKEVVIKTTENEFKILQQVENDRFSKNSGESFFKILENKYSFFADTISNDLKSKLQKI